MFTPPRLRTEVSWLKDQSPVHAGTATPDQCSMSLRAGLNNSNAISMRLMRDNLSGTLETSSPTLVNPASTLLQDLLKEQRAHRSSREKSPQPENWDDVGPRTPDGSRIQDDTVPEKERKAFEAFATGQRKPQEMGIREMDQVGPTLLSQDLIRKLTLRLSTFRK